MKKIGKVRNAFSFFCIFLKTRIKILINFLNSKNTRKTVIIKSGVIYGDENMKLDELVNQYYDDLNMNDLHIWGYIANHKRECAAMTIEEVAEKCNVSRTGILRFAKNISTGIQ